MGRSRIQWSAEEEAALRDGITKHGVGKWRKILDDPEFSSVLTIRTNVDLKDKWRNMNIPKGGSRNGYKPVQKIIKKPISHYSQSAALTSEGSGKDEIAAEPLAIIHKSCEDEDSDKLISSTRGFTTAALLNTGADKNDATTPDNEARVPTLITYTRRRGRGRTGNTTINGRNGNAVQGVGEDKFDDGKLDGLTNAKQPSSSTHKQEQLPPPNLKRFSWGNIKTATANGKLNKQKMEYDSADSDSVQAAVDAELMRIRQMSPEDAAAAAAAVVKKAKAAIAEADEAEKVAEEAERDAEEAKSVTEELKRKIEETKARPAAKRGKRSGSK